MTPDQALRYLEWLHAIDRVVHVAGGEAMMFWDDLIATCRLAAPRGLAPHFIETNATFAVSERRTQERLTALREAGICGVLISADPYHQRRCPPDRFLRCREVARSIFGAGNVICTDAPAERIRSLAEMGADEEGLGRWTRENPPRLSGRAGDELMDHFPIRPPEELRDAMWNGGEGQADCSLEFDPETMWEIHIDPDGSYQTCCCIRVGSEADDGPLPQLMARGFRGRSPVIDAVYDEGPQGLVRLAVASGYIPANGYPQKCGMCWTVRRYLRPHFPAELGPADVYDPLSAL